MENLSASLPLSSAPTPLSFELPETSQIHVPVTACSVQQSSVVVTAPLSYANVSSHQLHVNSTNVNPPMLSQSALPFHPFVPNVDQLAHGLHSSGRGPAINPVPSGVHFVNPPPLHVTGQPAPANSVAPIYITQDAASLHIVKQQLFQKASNPYAGEPHRFHSWLNALNNRLTGIDLSPYDKLLVLDANTSHVALKIVQKHMAIGGPDPSRTLQRVLTDLRSECGSNVRIANSLNEKVDAFPQIRSVYQLDKLKELLTLCEYIEANMDGAQELGIFNTAYGSQRIWMKLPENLQNSWRAICDDYRCNNGDRYPPFTHFVRFLNKKNREYSDPLFQKPQPREYGKRENTSLKTHNETVSNSCSDGNSPYTHRPFSQRTFESPNQCTFETPKQRPFESQHQRNSNIPNSRRVDVCPFHEDSKHSLVQCRKFGNLPYKEKIEMLRSKGLCFVCTGQHLRSKCTLKEKCVQCQGNHISILHPDQQRTIPNSNHDKSNLCTKICENSSLSKNCSKILLVDLTMDSSSKSLRCYAILDEQSSTTFADPKVAEFFNVSGPTTEYTLRTLSGSSTNTGGIILNGVKIKGVGERKRLNLPSMYTNPHIPDSRKEFAGRATVRAYPHIEKFAKNFNDPNVNAEVLLLVGRDAGQCMYTRCYGSSPPYVHHTALGWALVGNTCVTPKYSIDDPCVMRVDVSEHFSHSPCFNYQKKWHLQDLDIFATNKDDEKLGFSKDDQKFLATVNSDITSNERGNLVLPLPFKQHEPILPVNRAEVFYRTRSTLTRLTNDSGKLNKCLNVMKKYIAMGHVEPVPANELTPKKPGHAWWIPVFPVTHPKKDKVRIVFDSSARYHGTCLNDHLLPGPDINNRLKDVLLGFRNGSIGFSADVESMFHNFFLKPEQRDYVRFYWFRDNDASKDIIQYRGMVHIFGNCSSPAVASLGLRYAVKHPTEDKTSSLVSKFVTEQFYVDDGLGATDTPEEAVSILHDTRKALQRHNIRLHKICSSSEDVTNSFPESERATGTTVQLEENSNQTALGLIWETSRDSLILRSQVPDRPFTRRGILGTVNSVFDPLGISAPILLDGKHIQRSLLTAVDGTSQDSNYWDKDLPYHLNEGWESWKLSLRGLCGLEIPRSYRPANFGNVISVQLHGFCDASNDGTGYVIYLKSTNCSGSIHVAFVSGSSKIVPKTTPTIPRLELCAALDLSVAIDEAARKLDIGNDDVFMYSDSMIVLGYLRNTDKKFPLYVTRRTNLILSNSSVEQWKYVQTSENPADIASRRQSIRSLLNSCWLSGPALLMKEEYDPIEENTTSLPEVLPDAICLLSKPLVSGIFNNLLERCSNLNKVVRVTKRVVNLCRRWLDRSRQRLGMAMTPRDPVTLQESLNIIIRDTQQQHFPQLALLSSVKNNSFQSLSPFQDENSIIRVGGRLCLSDLEYENKFPILLPNKSHLSSLLIRHHHESVKHQGRHITLSAIRRAGYFVHKASSSIRKIISNCVVCRKLRLPLTEQRMSNLPRDRLEASPPFSNSGMDVFGPYLVSDGTTTRRSKANKKCWALILTCLNSRATHIEPLPSLDTPSLKNALRRFICVRGSVKKLRSDQGSNFIGVLNQETSINEEDIRKELSNQTVEWELTPPKASHFGGVWERQIQSVKNILNSCLHQLGTRILTRDDLYTFFQECVSILNNTPLWEHSADPNDPRPLTPAMLLNLRTDQPISSEDFQTRDLLAYGKRRWRRIQYLADQFWSRWRNDYLQTLHKRRKWFDPTRNLQVGDVVLLKDSSLKRYRWPMARVIGTKTSSDGLVRSVELVTSGQSPSSKRHLHRPVTELSLLVPVADHV